MYKFWIDVGGTFTDCLALDEFGNETTVKVLSSGVVVGEWSPRADPASFADAQLIGFGPEFFAEYTLCLVDGVGERIASRSVKQFDSQHGRLVLDRPFAGQESQRATRYELFGGEPAPILCVRRVLRLSLNAQLPPLTMALGTTRGTNALLTRSGAAVGLVITAGFGDLLEIGEQDRAQLFELTIRKPLPLTSSVLEVEERIGADGTILQALDREQVLSGLRTLRQKQITSLAIVLMHGYRYPQHEQQIAAWAREVGFDEISVSHQTAPAIKIVPRAETTVMDAYLNPVVRRYVDDLRNRLGPDSRLELMTSHGGLVPADRFTGKDCVLSGPAGGVVGFVRVAEPMGITRAIGFDMGGTSTDVARFDGQFDVEYESRKAGVRIVAPMLAIETVAAGGGSICHFDGARLAVGPASAGAEPGPACYGRGGPLTVTDVNLYLGRLADDQFPFPLDRSAAERQLDRLRRQVAEHSGHNLSLIELANGLREIANRNMASAVHAVSVARGFDPADDVLVAFGGAGPQHAAQVAELLGIRRVIIHPRSSILSAVGIRLADRTMHRAQPIMRIGDDALWHELQTCFDRLSEEASAELNNVWQDARNIVVRRSLDLRYIGTETSLNVEQPPDGDFVRQFHREHERWYGYRQTRKVEVVTARVVATAIGERLPFSQPPDEFRPAQSTATQDVCLASHFEPISQFQWSQLRAGDQILGPALIVDSMTTVAVESGWYADVWADRQLHLRREGDLRKVMVGENIAAEVLPTSAETSKSSRAANPIHLQVFNHRFTSIAREMGLTLQRTAVSVNIRDRLDFSCAIFSSAGDLVVNAPHIPVHLGAMSETVRQLIATNPNVMPGDAFVTNDPYRGGSHLPDVTVVTPVFLPGASAPTCWVASRGHHAEIGGKTPGSMPPDARCLADEGVVIPPMKLIDRGIEQFARLEHLLTSASYPSRAVDDNLADIRAQLAANKRGVDRLLEFIAEQSPAKVIDYMELVQTAAEQLTRTALRKMPDGSYTFSDQMDSGARICVSIEKRDDWLSIDFASTSPVQPDNLNANRAIVLAATMYVMRCLLGADIPLNQGILRPVELKIPICMLNPTPGPDASTSPAIVGGNVETSQRVVDCLLGALGLAAASQGTMNNWLMGNKHFGYYETLGGGAGATPEGPGADAVHTHMSNTRLTDPEVLETRFPVRIHRLAIRRGSGGRGAHRGGDGMIREIEFLSAVEVSLLTSRRTTAPYGLAGGGPGAPGINRLHRVDGTEEILPFRVQFSAAPGDRLTLETPGAGAYSPQLQKGQA